MVKAKIVTILGARPQFIKAAAVSRVIREKFSEVIVHTGQHYDKEMSGNFFRELNLPKANYNLGIAAFGHGEQVGRMLMAIEKALMREKPRLVIVYGDTNSTLAGALAAAKLKIPIAHIEAGLRSYRKDLPEEINRVLTDHLANFLFCPTKNAVYNLHKEGISKGVYNVGDVMYDSLLLYLDEARKKSKILKKLNINKGSYFLATVHRAENTDSYQRLGKIINLLSNLGRIVIFPAHPRTEKMLKNFNIKIYTDKVRLIKPVSYFDMLMLESNSRAILTDSGGIQKEAYLLKVPAFILRKETEWLETTEGGSNFLIDLDKNELSRRMKQLCVNIPRSNTRLFGDGFASKKILSVLKNNLPNSF